MRRGEVWWTDLPPPIGRRPVVLISRNEAYPIRDLVIVAPVTRRIREIRAEVALGPKEGLPKRCVANLETIRTIPKRRLTKRIASLSPEKLAEVDQALKFALGLSK